MNERQTCKWAVPHVGADVLWAQSEREGLEEHWKSKGLTGVAISVRWAQFVAQRWVGIRAAFQRVSGSLPTCDYGGYVGFIEVDYIPRLRQPALICDRCSGVDYSDEMTRIAPEMMAKAEQEAK
jgi:hypothetical protein